MSYHVRDYHQALEKIMAAPLELREKDFDVLRAFNPGDERRGRDAQKRAQLAQVPPAPLQTNAAPKSRPPVMNTKVLQVMGEFIDASTKTIVALGDRVKRLDKQAGALGKRVQELEDLTRSQAAELVDLREANVALGKLVVTTQRPTISVDPSHGLKH